MKQQIDIITQKHPSSQRARGYILLEIVIAMGLFASVSVALIKALHITSETAVAIQDDMRIQRVLQSAMIDALSNPNLEEGQTVENLATVTGDEGDDAPFLTGELETLVEPMELENEDGELLQDMFRVRVTFYWFADGERKQESAEVWRYANLYQP